MHSGSVASPLKLQKPGLLDCWGSAPDVVLLRSKFILSTSRCRLESFPHDFVSMWTYSGYEVFSRLSRELNPIAFIQSCHHLALKIVLIAPACQGEVPLWGKSSVNLADPPYYPATI